MFLVVLGQSAGVLAYDLSAAGYWALDIRHIDLEYEWYLQGGGRRVPVSNKYNNEVLKGSNVEQSEEYLAQIIEQYDGCEQ